MSIQPPKIDNRSYKDIVNQTVELVENFTAVWVEPTHEALCDRILAEDIIKIISISKQLVIFSFFLLTQSKLYQLASQLLREDLKIDLEGNKAEDIITIISISISKQVVIFSFFLLTQSKLYQFASQLLREDLKIDLEGNKAEDIITIKIKIVAKANTLVTPDVADKIAATKQTANLVKVRVEALQGEQESTLVIPIPELLKSCILDENIIDIDGQIIAKAGESVNPELAEKIAKLKTQLVKVKVKDWHRSEKPDAGMALISIFGRMAALVSDRLNQVPEKNFLKFLDLIGTQISPPQPARVPLTFSLVKGSSVDALVPAGTQIAASPMKEEDEEVVFETEQELVVVSAQLTAVFVREPIQDKYSDRTLQATGEKDAAFEAFRGDKPIEHSLYLACKELFAIPGDKTVTLTINSPQASDGAKLPPISWSYFDGTTWIDLSANTADATNNSWQITIENLPVISPSKIDSLESRWLRASLNKLILPIIIQPPQVVTETSKQSNEKSGVIKLTVDNVTDLKSGDFIRLAWGSNQQEDCQIKDVYEKDKTLNFEKKLNYNYPEGIWIRLLAKFPTVNWIAAISKITREKLAPDFCFFNTVPIDLSKDFYPFGEQPRFNDTLYIANQEVFARPGANFTITMQLSSSPPLPITPSSDLEIAWEAWDGKTWTSLDNVNETNETKIFTNSTYSRNFTLPNNITPVTVGGENKYWIRARIVKGNFGTELSQTTTIAILTEESKTKRELMVNSVRGFMPNDKVQIVTIDKAPENREIESIDNAKNKITLKAVNQEAKTPPEYPRGTSVMLLSDSAFGPPSLKSLSLSYEYETSRSLSACCAYNDFHYVELTTALRENAKSGEKILKLASVAGFAKGDRLRIDAGGSNPEDYEIEITNPSNQTVTLKQALNCNYNQGILVVRSFELFTPTADQNPTLYLGFDKAFPNRAIALYFQVESPQPGEMTKALEDRKQQTTNSPRIVWEYYNSKDWVSLGVADETNAFTQRGLIKFIGPNDFSCRNEFGQSLYWIRARWESGEFLVQPRLRRIRTNTTWASQATTIKEELLGSSDGNPNQTYRTAQVPVLEEQRLEVRELEVSSSEKRAALKKLLGADALTIVPDELGQVEEVWVMWKKVRDFYESSSNDRHYTIDRLTGKIQFGDGKWGMIPPQGRNNIRLAQYRTGGGKKGNLPENRITQIKTTIPYVESVTNYEAAGGGAEQESLERVKERGPKWLRHRDRAVAWQDFEDLAYEASPEVARAKAITPELKTPEFNPLDPKLWINPNQKQSSFVHNIKAGQIELIIVPLTQERQPTPSIALLDKVKSYIRQRCAPTVELIVIGPQWQEVTVIAKILPVSPEKGDEVRTNVLKKLESFLHPLNGGKGDGWDFGRYPHKSNLYTLIQSIPDVDRIPSLEITVGGERSHSSNSTESQTNQTPSTPRQTNQSSQLKQLNGANYLIYSGKHQITIV